MSTPKRLLLALVMTLLAAPAVATDCTDAEILALEISGEPLPPPAMVDQIEQDLASIREANPYLAQIHVMPTWVPGRIVVKLTDDALAEYQAGEYHDLDELNATYGAVKFQSVFSSWFRLEFADPYNPSLVAPEYDAVESVLLAEPDGIIGDGDDIYATEVGRYTFKHGWGDCPAGCIKAHFWVYTVQGSLVQLVDEYGDDFTAASDTASPGSLKSYFIEQE